jgi:hypothetical protein
MLGTIGLIGIPIAGVLGWFAFDHATENAPILRLIIRVLLAVSCVQGWMHLIKDITQWLS